MSELGKFPGWDGTEGYVGYGSEDGGYGPVLVGVLTPGDEWLRGMDAATGVFDYTLNILGPPSTGGSHEL